MGMTRDERKSRVVELERWLEDQHAEYEDDEFPEELRSQWNERNSELNEHRRILRELEERDNLVSQLAQQGHDNNREDAVVNDTTSVRQNGSKSSPSVIMRMAEHEVYDLHGLSGRSMFDSSGRASRELRDRAMRAIELAQYGDGQTDRARCQEHVAFLLDQRDTADRAIAQRILMTGSPVYKQAFGRTISAQLRGAIPMLSTEEHRAMEMVSRAMSLTGGSPAGSQGGFAVPYQLDPTVIPTSNLSVNPFRAISRVDTIPGNEWRGVTSAGVSAAYAGSDSPAPEASDNSPTLLQPSMLMQRAQAFVPVSIELEQDWGGLQTELAQLIQDAKDDLEASAFTTGSGTGQPQGIITGATTLVSTAVTGGSFAVGDLYALEQAVGPRFRPRMQLVANRATWNRVRQFDTAGGAGLWVYLPAGLDNQVPRGGNLGVQVLGYPASEDSAMAGGATLSNGDKIMVAGDFRYYLIVDRVGLDIEVIPHLFGSSNRFPTGQRGFFAYWRNNAQVLSANAFRVLTVR